MESVDYISRLRQGSEDAFKELFDTHYAALCRSAERFLQDRFHAEAVVTEAIFGLWKVRATIKDDINLRAYLHQAVKNRCLNYMKSKYKRSEIPFTLLYDDTTVLERTAPVTDSHQAMGSLLTKELEDKIMEAVGNLPDKTREVFEKNRFEGKRYEDIAAETGLSVNTVKYHMKRALSLLRESLGPYLFSIALFLFRF